MKDWGFNMIRLGVMWPGLEPTKGEYSSDYLDRIEEIINICQKHDIYVLLDFHQDLLSRKFCGEGIPDWAVFNHNFTHRFPYPLDRDFVFIDGIPVLNAVINITGYYINLHKRQVVLIRTYMIIIMIF